MRFSKKVPSLPRLLYSLEELLAAEGVVEAINYFGLELPSTKSLYLREDDNGDGEDIRPTTSGEMGRPMNRGVRESV